MLSLQEDECRLETGCHQLPGTRVSCVRLWRHERTQATPRKCQGKADCGHMSPTHEK